MNNGSLKKPKIPLFFGKTAGIFEEEKQ